MEPKDRIIVLVEDEPDTLEVITEFLTEYGGHAVRPALNGEIAVQLFNETKENLGLVITDFSLGRGMSGGQMLKLMDQLGMNVPRIVLSGGEESWCRKECGKYDRWLQKPIDPRVLLLEIKKLLS